jgi:hypothetical protein
MTPGLAVPYHSVLADRSLFGHAAAWGYGISANRYAILELQGFPGCETSQIAEMKVT